MTIKNVYWNEYSGTLTGSRPATDVFRLETTVNGDTGSASADARIPVAPGKSFTVKLTARQAAGTAKQIALKANRFSGGNYENLAVLPSNPSGIIYTGSFAEYTYRFDIPIGTTDELQLLVVPALEGLNIGDAFEFNDNVDVVEVASGANAGADQTVAANSVVTLTGTPAGGTWTQESGAAVTLSAPTTTANDTRVTFVANNASTSNNEVRVFRYTVNDTPAGTIVYTQGFEDTTLGGWARSSTSATTATANITNSIEIARTGSHALKAEITGSGGNLAVRGVQFDVTSGVSYTASAWTRQTNATGRRIWFSWRDSAGNFVSDSTRAFSTKTTNTWEESTITATAPDNISKAIVYVETADVVTGNTMYLDDVTVKAA